jgi:hypothetical protein
VQARLYVEWFIERFLPAAAWTEDARAIATAWAEFDRARATAWAEFDKARGTALFAILRKYWK